MLNLDRVRVKDIMSRNPVSTAPDTTLDVAARIMYTFNIGSIVVVERGGYVVGIVTERDLMRAIALDRYPGETPLWEVMSRDPITIDPERSVLDALKIMVENNIRHLPVVDRERRLVGILSMRDIVHKALGGYTEKK